MGPGTAPDAASRLLTRPFLLLLAATACTFANYATLLSVVPMWADRGGAGSSGAGATTGAVMGTTVAIQLVMPQLLSRFGARSALAAGALLLGVPTLGYLHDDGLAWVLLVSAVRGLGFGIVAVAGAALVAERAPERRRGQALGLYGVAVGIPSVVLQPLGVWVAETVSFAPVFLASAVLCVLGAPLVLALPGRPPAAPPTGATGLRRLSLRAPWARAPWVRGASVRGAPVQGLATMRGTPHRKDPRRAGRARDGVDRLDVEGVRLLGQPFLVMLVVACALGGVISFLPLSLAEPGTASLALFVLFLSAMLARWAAGTWSDRAGVGRLLLAAMALGVVGMAGLALAVQAEESAALIALPAAGLYGVGWGVLQSEVLVIMFRRAGPRRVGTASAVWNMAYDAGTGIGGVAVGLLAGPLAMSGAFAVMAVAMALVLPLGWREARQLH